MGVFCQEVLELSLKLLLFIQVLDCHEPIQLDHFEAMVAIFKLGQIAVPCLMYVPSTKPLVLCRAARSDEFIKKACAISDLKALVVNPLGKSKFF